MKPLKPLYKALYYIIFPIAMVAIRVVYPIRRFGMEHLKGQKDGYVLSPNHLSAIDPMFVLLARGFGQKMLIMGKEELFGRNFILDFLWKVFGAFPVDRGTGDLGTVNRAMDAVKHGRSLLLFPEGTRSKTGKLGRLKSGAFVIAAGAGADIIPCIIRYKAGGPRPFNRISVAFGPALTLADLGLGEGHSPRALREAKKRYTRALDALWDQYGERM